MARAPRYSARDNIMAVLQGRTQREAAAFLGVSERTIRRWKNEGVQPSRQHAPVLSQGAARARKSIRDSARKIPTITPVPRIPVPPRVTRRTIHVRDIRGQPTGQMRLSDWASYDVRDMENTDIHVLLKWARDRNAVIQITYHVPKGGTSLGGRELREGGNASTSLIDLTGMNDVDLWEEIEHVTHIAKGANRRIIAVNILDKRAQGRKR